MLIKTENLTGAALDWAVAGAEGLDPFTDGISWIVSKPGAYVQLPRYSTDWSQGGSIIEQERIDLTHYADGGHPDGGECGATLMRGRSIYEAFGPTLLVAAMRVYVMSRLGDEVEVPDELA